MFSPSIILGARDQALKPSKHPCRHRLRTAMRGGERWHAEVRIRACLCPELSITPHPMEDPRPLSASASLQVLGVSGGSVGRQGRPYSCMHRACIQATDFSLTLTMDGRLAGLWLVKEFGDKTEMPSVDLALETRPETH